MVLPAPVRPAKAQSVASPVRRKSIAPPVRPQSSRRHRSPCGPWAEQELRVARAKVDAKLFEQALVTLQGIVAKEGVGETATEAYFLMASVHERQGRIEDAMATYLEFAHRYRKDARAPEALFLMAQSTLRTKRATKEADARSHW